MNADAPPAPHPSPNFQYVLYVHAACTNSESILALLKDTIPKGVVKVQSIERIKPLPPWLNGTPIFVDSMNGTIYRGQEAFHAILKVT